MADVLDLGSLLPTGYAAPDVQGILGGELNLASCNPGTSPSESCGQYGTSPSATCIDLGGDPKSTG
ncbi:MAG: hypothetical protein FVQ84_13455 [Planctomycetes bacterium]|nr:hypothetical protein [Planctomycetota bacterium]